MLQVEDPALFRDKNKKKVLGLIMFSTSSVKSVDNIILQYLNFPELKKIAESRKRELKDQLYIQIPARQIMRATYERLLEDFSEKINNNKMSLMPIDEYSGDKSFIALQKAYQSYMFECQTKLFDYVQNCRWESMDFAESCIMHCCYSHPKSASGLLANIVEGYNTNKNHLIKLLIKYEVKLTKEILYSAIQHKLPLETIEIFYNKLLENNVVPLLSSKRFNFAEVAATHKDSNVSVFVKKNFPETKPALECKESGTTSALPELERINSHKFLFRKQNIEELVAAYKENISKFGTSNSNLMFEDTSKRTFIECTQVEICQYFEKIETLESYFPDRMADYYLAMQEALKSEPFTTSLVTICRVNPAHRDRLEKRLSEVNAIFNRQPKPAVQPTAS